VRNFNGKKDLEKVHDLYKSCLSNYIHFYRDPKTIEHFTHFPSVKKTIYVAVSDDEEYGSDGKVLGFIVITIVNENGYTKGIVRDLCSVNETVSGCLIKKALDYCDQEGADIVAVASFPDEKEKIFKKSEGWFEANPYLFMGKVASPLHILRLLLKSKFELLKIFPNGILFVIDNESFHVKTGKRCVLVEVAKGNVANADFSVKMSNKVLSKIVFRVANPYIEYLRRKIKIKGLMSTPSILQSLINKCRILEILTSLRLPEMLYLAIIDVL